MGWRHLSHWVSGFALLGFAGCLAVSDEGPPRGPLEKAGPLRTIESSQHIGPHPFAPAFLLLREDGGTETKNGEKAEGAPIHESRKETADSVVSMSWNTGGSTEKDDPMEVWARHAAQEGPPTRLVGFRVTEAAPPAKEENTGGNNNPTPFSSSSGESSAKPLERSGLWKRNGDVGMLGAPQHNTETGSEAETVQPERRQTEAAKETGTETFHGRGEESGSGIEGDRRSERETNGRTRSFTRTAEASTQTEEEELGDTYFHEGTFNTEGSCITLVGPVAVDATHLAVSCTGPIYLKNKGDGLPPPFMQRRLLFTNKGTRPVTVRLAVSNSNFVLKHQDAPAAAASDTANTGVPKGVMNLTKAETEAEAAMMTKAVKRFERKYPGFQPEIILSLLSPRDTAVAFDDNTPSFLMTPEGQVAAARICYSVAQALGMLFRSQDDASGDNTSSCQLLKETDFIIVRLPPEADAEMAAKEQSLFKQILDSGIVTTWEIAHRVGVQMTSVDSNLPESPRTPSEALKNKLRARDLMQRLPEDGSWSDKQWGLFAAKCPQAFILGEKGTQEVVVAVIDSGIWAHRNLDSNVLRVNSSDNAKNSPSSSDTFGHGTHVSGIIAASSRVDGISGCAPDVKLLEAKFTDAGGEGSVASAIAAIDFALSQKVHVINNSWGSHDDSRALRRCISLASKAKGGKGVLVVNSAGNTAQNLDQICSSVASHQPSNAITVAAMNADGALTSYSNYGIQSVHIAAPGEKIYSNLPGNRYGYRSGTSVAAPFVTAVAALVYGAFANVGGHPSAQEVKDILRVSSAPEADLADKVAWGSMVDAEAAVLVTHLGGMWTQVKCSDKLFELQPNEERVATVYVRAYLPGDYKARIQVDVLASSGARLSSGGFDMETSSNKFITTEIRQANNRKAVEAETAYGDKVSERKEENDLCDLQARYLVTSSALGKASQKEEGESNDAIMFGMAAAGGLISLVVIGGVLYYFREKLCGQRGKALEETYEDALENARNNEPPEFGEVSEKKPQQRVQFAESGIRTEWEE